MRIYIIKGRRVLNLFCYKIVNNINQKAYIGITIDFDQRIKQHKRQTTNSLIHKAILKYGEDNFTFLVLAEGLSVEEAEEMENSLIKKENTLAPNGYNLAKGGLYGGAGYKITDEQVLYIKQHRNLPEYLLYDEFSELITYSYFKMLYRNQARLDIQPTIEEYPYNLEFSCQFTRTKMTYQDIIEIRQGYAEMIDWKTMYPKYKDKVACSTFFDIYRGQQFTLIMPEVFSEENKKKHSSFSHSGEKNANAKLTIQDVRNIRLLHLEGKTNKEIAILYPQVSISSIFDIIKYRS